MKKILIVDDEAHARRITRLALTTGGYSVEEAENGLIALERIAECPPNVMITDIDMPKMDGQTLCKEIQETLPDRTFLIIVITARAEHEHRAWAAEIPNLEFMEKPVSIRRLVSHLDNYYLTNEPRELNENYG